MGISEAEREAKAAGSSAMPAPASAAVIKPLVLAVRMTTVSERPSFANARIFADDDLIARASATFRIIARVAE